MRRYLTFFAAALALAPSVTQADQVVNDDLIVTRSGCVGVACANGEDFQSGTVELKLKSTRPTLYFEDTSTNVGVTRDWWIETLSNDLRVTDEDFDRFIFSDEGFFGVGGISPATELHVVGGDTPTLRLEQDTSEGNRFFRWDIAGNEANFFVRDTGAGTLPFRIKPAAPTNSFYIREDGDIGMGTAKPAGKLHIRANQPRNVPNLVLDSPNNSGRAEIWFQDGRTQVDNDALRLQLNGDNFNISFNGTGGTELRVAKSGDVSVMRGDLLVPNGGVTVGGQGLNVPDYVFAPDYELMPLDEVADFVAEHSHLPHVPSASEVREGGLDMVQMQLAMLRTIEEQMLHILSLEAELNVLRDEVKALRLP
jgi:hypothetical protein